MGRKLFDYVIGNPPYQEAYERQSSGANSVYPESVKVKRDKTALQEQENSQPRRCCG